METPGYKRDSGPLPDNSEIVDIKMIGKVTKAVEIKHDP